MGSPAHGPTGPCRLADSKFAKAPPGFSQGQQKRDITLSELAAGGEGDSKGQGRERQAHGDLKDHQSCWGPGPRQPRGIRRGRGERPRLPGASGISGFMIKSASGDKRHTGAPQPGTSRRPTRATC